jgi:hypothetical protein
MGKSDHPTYQLMKWNKQNHLQYPQQHVTGHQILCVEDTPPTFHALNYTAEHQRGDAQPTICVRVQAG